MERFAVKDHSKCEDRVRLVIFRYRLNGDWYFKRARHTQNCDIRLRSDNLEFLNGVPDQSIHIVTIVFARDDRESRRLNQFLWSRGKIGRHECRTVLLTYGRARAGGQFRSSAANRSHSAAPRDRAPAKS